MLHSTKCVGPGLSYPRIIFTFQRFFQSFEKLLFSVYFIFWVPVSAGHYNGWFAMYLPTH